MPTPTPVDIWTETIAELDKCPWPAKELEYASFSVDVLLIQIRVFMPTVAKMAAWELKRRLA